MTTLHDAPPPYRTVVFDCDSTLSTIEGIDELAALKLDESGRAELVELTHSAMRGDVPLEEVYARRMAAVAPSRAELEKIGRRYVETALPGTIELFAELRAAGVKLRIVSGGLRPAVLVLGAELGLAPDHVHAVDVRFDARGDYLDFERDSPLARSGGKLELLRELGGADALGPIALIGDGMTDLECAPELARFVAFTGVVRREAVVERALHTVDTLDLSALLPLLIG